MSDIFSHAPAEPKEESGPLPPIEIARAVAAQPEQAFLGWTEHIHLWWPMAEYSVSGEDGFIDFEGGELVETSAGDQMISWGTVLSSEPPSYLSFSWHPGANPLQGTEVQLAFSPLPGADSAGLEADAPASSGTELTLTHIGWENLPDAPAVRAKYLGGWPGILDRYVRFMGGPA
ncbi:SRPBCC domain-containing protein [Arthrobacter monumenti]